MKFSEVSYAELSGLTHEIFLSRRPRIGPPELKIVKFAGTYRIGYAGAPDARAICAACEAAATAWFTFATILDFTDLDYQWGDEMTHVFSLGWDSAAKTQAPLAVVVGAKCRGALQTLLRSRYEEYCRDTRQKAIKLAQQKRVALDEHRKADHARFLADWKAKPGA